MFANGETKKTAATSVANIKIVHPMRVNKLIGWATVMRVHQVSYMGTYSHVWLKRQGTKKARVRDEQLTDALRSGLPLS